MYRRTCGSPSSLSIPNHCQERGMHLGQEIHAQSKPANSEDIPPAMNLSKSKTFLGKT